MPGQPLGVKVFQELQVELEDQFPKENIYGAKIRER